MRCVAAACSLVLALAACAPEAPTASAAPWPTVYTCDQQRRALAELQSLPATAQLWIMMDDYRVMRRQLRALHRHPEPAECR